MHARYPVRSSTQKNAPDLSVRQGKPEHPVKGEGAIEIAHTDADMIDPLDCNGLGHWEDKQAIEMRRSVPLEKR
jgi:hypothetical protein